MNGYLVGALVALAAAGYFVWQRQEATRKHGRLLSVETSTTGALHAVHRAAVEAAGAGAFSERVELAGTTQPGPGGLLHSPLSETPCVWHKHMVTRRYRDVQHDSKGNRTTSTREEVVTNEQSRDPFLVRDADGEVLVRPSKGSMSGTRKSVSRFEDKRERSSSRIKVGSFELALPSEGDGDTLGYEYEEWVLLPGLHVFVKGEATDVSGELVVRNPKGAENLVVSTKSEDELIDAAVSTSRRNTLFAAGSAALAVVLVVLAFTIG